MNDQGMGERGLRSVFIGNIPYEVSEDRLKEIFGQVGPVLSMKLVFDRESGKPKGYGFCEYQDAETAMSAMRNLNGVEVNGRNLRVDNAGAQGHLQQRIEMQQMSQMNQNQNQQQVLHNNGPNDRDRDRDRERPLQQHSDHQQQHFPMHHQHQQRGDIEGPPPPERVPEIISKTVASLAPEQMFDLMKQMKQCIQNNPNEARTMLVQNPQLAYALLQAQVVMKMIDPGQALSMLHKDNSGGVGMVGGISGVETVNQRERLPQPQFGANVVQENPWLAAERAAAGQPPPVMPMNPPGPFGSLVGINQQQQSVGAGGQAQSIGPGDMDFRQIVVVDPRLRNAGNLDLDLRDPRSSASSSSTVAPSDTSSSSRYQMDPRGSQSRGDRDFREQQQMSRSEQQQQQRERERERDRDRDMRGQRGVDRQQHLPRDSDLRDRQPSQSQSQSSADPRISNQQQPPLDPRSRAAAARAERSDTTKPQQPQQLSSLQMSSGIMAGFGAGMADSDKAALIMQVLQLSDEQIGMLPVEQRQSIVALKEQIAKTTTR